MLNEFESSGLVSDRDRKSLECARVIEMGFLGLEGEHDDEERGGEEEERDNEELFAEIRGFRGERFSHFLNQECGVCLLFTEVMK